MGKSGNDQMRYPVQLVGENALHGADWALVEFDHLTVLGIRRDKMSAETLAEAWEGYRKSVT